MAMEGAGAGSGSGGSGRENSLSEEVLSDVWTVLSRMVEELSTSWNVLEEAGVVNERREQSAFPVECADCRMLCGLAAVGFIITSNNTVLNKFLVISNFAALTDL